LSAHNLQYWKNKPYFGFGAGAHGYIDGFRTVNYKLPRRYIQSMNSPAGGFEFPRSPVTEETISIDREAEIRETLMMGLRLIDEGVSNQTFESRFGDWIEDHFEKEIHYLQNAGLVYWRMDGSDQRLCLTQKGVLLGNQVFMQFL
jgi:oxygen-independent coproporphyrinogen-3 oxidase